MTEFKNWDINVYFDLILCHVKIIMFIGQSTAEKFSIVLYGWNHTKFS